METTILFSVCRVWGLGFIGFRVCSAGFGAQGVGLGRNPGFKLQVRGGKP